MSCLVPVLCLELCWEFLIHLPIFDEFLDEAHHLTKELGNMEGPLEKTSEEFRVRLAMFLAAAGKRKKATPTAYSNTGSDSISKCFPKGHVRLSWKLAALTQSTFFATRLGSTISRIKSLNMLTMAVATWS